MAFGPGKYDQTCSLVREATKAEGVVLIIFNGVHGNGFSCQASPEVTMGLPDMLEHMARQIRADLSKL